MQVIQAQPVAVNVAATVIRQGEGTAEGIAAAFTVRTVYGDLAAESEAWL